jgi:hypothetical protein
MLSTQNAIDLNIENYKLQDILHLFKIPIDFDENDLKKAKQIVLKTHPDKSGLQADYFRFYSKAYKSLYEIWTFRKKGDINANIADKNTEYTQEETNTGRKQILDNLLNKKVFKTDREFNVWFNSSFEKHKLFNESDDTGYGDWLKEEDKTNIQQNDNITLATMGEEFERKKREARTLIVQNEIRELDTMFGGCNLSTDAPSNYNSGLFSSLPYQDLHTAHTETVIPVTREDYDRKQKFHSTDEYIQFRGHQDQVVKPLSEFQAQQYLKNREKMEEQQATKRAYELAKQTEQAKKNDNMFWKELQRLR